MAWEDLEDEMSDIITDEFKIRGGVRHIPMKKPANGRAIVDPDRAAYDTVGIFEWVYSEIRLTKGQDLNRVNPSAFHSQRRAYLSVESRDIIRDCPDDQCVIKQGDVFLLIEKDLRFEVADVQPDGQGRIMIPLNQQGQHIQT